MRMFPAAVALGVSVIGLSIVVSNVDARPGPTPNKFVGTFLGTIDFNDGQNQVSFPALGAIHADGTMTVSDADDYIPGQLSSIDGVAHGSWVMAGPDTVKAATIYHAFDANGVLAYTGRIDIELTLVDGEPGATGFGVAKIYFPGMDPARCRLRDRRRISASHDSPTRALTRRRRGRRQCGACPAQDHAGEGVRSCTLR